MIYEGLFVAIGALVLYSIVRLSRIENRIETVAEENGNIHFSVRNELREYLEEKKKEFNSEVEKTTSSQNSYREHFNKVTELLKLQQQVLENSLKEIKEYVERVNENADEEIKQRMNWHSNNFDELQNQLSETKARVSKLEQLEEELEDVKQEQELTYKEFDTKIMEVKAVAEAMHRQMLQSKIGQLSKLKQQVYHYLTTEPEMNYKEIAKRIGSTQASVGNAVRELRNNGYVASTNSEQLE